MASLNVRTLAGALLVGSLCVVACKQDDRVLDLQSTSAATSPKTSTSSGSSDACPGGELLCGGACSPVALDPQNCGGCDVACADGEVCSGGKCAVVCGSGTTKCDVGGKPQCVDPDFDPANCGACGKACSAGELCSMGTCGVACGEGSTKCGEKCTNTAFDPKNCSGCGLGCFTGAFAVGFCAEGTCGFQCTAGHGDCNGSPVDGCETTLDTVAHCGACSTSCNLANATAACASSSCAILTCLAGFGNCDKKSDTGCEVSTTTSDQHCGACGNACGATDHCVAGVCKPKGLVLLVEGHADVIADCQKGDHSCQAKAVCESVTGFNCTHQDYDCFFGNTGSWYPEDGNSGSSNFNFAYGYDFGNNSDYGNICACDSGKMGTYGLAPNHQFCGLGHWTLQ